jgi:hypothetical protein
MRKLYTFLAAATIAVGATAQNEVYFDDFESNALDGYTLYNIDGLVPDDPGLDNMADSAWTIKTIASQGWTFNRSAFSVSWYENDAGPSNDWLITPAITIAGEAILEWDAIAITSSGNFRDRYQVYVVFSNDYDEILADENTALIFDTGAEGEIASPTERSVDLAALNYADQTIYLAFRNFTQPFGSNPGGPGNGGNELAIDNIRVTDNSSVSTNESAYFMGATVQPNPAVGNSSVRFSLEQTEEVYLELTDLSGKVLSINNHGIMSPGSHLLTIERGDLASGIYLLRLRTTHHTHAMRVLFR